MSKPLITIVGMGRGISSSVAKKFGEQGFQVAMIARNMEKLRQFETDLSEAGIEAKGYAADVTDFDSLRKAMQEVRKSQGDSEILLYNVSAYREMHPSELNPDILVQDFKANVAGALVAIQEVVEAMKVKLRGTIFLTGGGTAIKAPAVLSSLGIGKAGIRSLAHSLYDELNKYKIHVSTITVHGAVAKGTRFDPDKIADKFWDTFVLQENDRKWEVMFD